MPNAGQRVGEYVLADQIGVGAFGEVWRAHHHAWHDRIVAVKIPNDPQYIRQLQQEGRTSERLSHPNLVKPISFDPFADPPYLVMEYVPGGSLRDVIKRGPSDSLFTVSVLRQVVAALEHAHAKGVVHRDIKPENVLLDERVIAEKGITAGAVRLTDFGLGVTTQTNLQQSVLMSMETKQGTELAGTTRYMAPELLDGAQADAQSDLYACGIMLFELLTGRRPAGVEVPSDLNSHVWPELDEVYRRAVARREKRYPSAAAFGIVLRDEAFEIEQAERLAKPRRGNQPSGQLFKLTVLLVLAVVFGLIAVVGLRWMRVSGTERRAAKQNHEPSVELPPTNPATSPTRGQTAQLADETRRRLMDIAAQKAAELAADRAARREANQPRISPAPQRQSDEMAKSPVTREIVKPRRAEPEPAKPGSKSIDQVKVVGEAATDEATLIAAEVSTRNPKILPPGSTLELLKTHDASDFRKHSGRETKREGSYSAKSIVGGGGFIMLFGIYEKWTKGKYLIVYRIAPKKPTTDEKSVCFLDVCVNATTFSGRRPDGDEVGDGEWRALPVLVELKRTETLEYRFWPHNREYFVDRVYVYRFQDSD